MNDTDDHHLVEPSACRGPMSEVAAAGTEEGSRPVEGAPDRPHREVRRGERFLDPKAVALYTKDFAIETVIDRAPPQAKELQASLTAEQLEKHAAKQAASWEGHYKTNTGLYPIKNYVAQAFPTVFLAWEAADAAAAADSAPKVPRCIVECGCGVGSALLPLAHLLPNDTFIGFDISASAVGKLNQHVRTVESKGRIRGFVRDVASEDLPPELYGTADGVLLVFVLSAVGRSRQLGALKRLRKLMKDTNSRLCFRDYGRYDHNEKRFFDNKNKIVDGGYVKGDGTQQCFFELEETRQLFRDAGFTEVVPLEYHCNRVHNRKTDVEMRKVFINAVFAPTE